MTPAMTYARDPADSPEMADAKRRCNEAAAALVAASGEAATAEALRRLQQARRRVGGLLLARDRAQRPAMHRR